MKASTRHITAMALMALSIAAALPLGLLAGSVDLSPAQVWGALTGADTDSLARFIVVENRLPSLLTAICAGAALSVAGLLMQTCFDNPLAGPSIMGISGGASLGVALVLLAAGSVAGAWGKLAVASGALGGALIVILLLAIFSSLVKSGDVLLILGILIGYLSSSLITMLNYFATESSVHSFVLWGMGTFSAVSAGEALFFCPACLLLTAACCLYAKSLNTLLMGEGFASAVGVATRRVRGGLLVLSGALTAVVTAWCGPVGFIGLIAPHIARMALASSNHHVLIPASALCGALIAILCQIASVAPSMGNGSPLPLNAITALVGVPVIVYIMFNRKKLLYFN